MAKCDSPNIYVSIVCHSNSLEWIYNKICQDYDIQQKGIHFLNVIDLQYDPETKTPAEFYNEYRTLIINNVGRANESYIAIITKHCQLMKHLVPYLKMSSSSMLSH